MHVFDQQNSYAFLLVFIIISVTRSDRRISEIVRKEEYERERIKKGER